MIQREEKIGTRLKELNELLLEISNSLANVRSLLTENNENAAELIESTEFLCQRANNIVAKMLPDNKISEEDDDIEKMLGILAGKKILILDDEKPVLRMLKRCFEYADAAVVCATEPEKILEEYGNAMKSGSKFDVVILDMVIKGKFDGILCMENLLGLDPSAKIVMSSGYVESISNEIRDKFTAVLKKPYTYGELVETIAGVISPSRESK
jgi:CheY-like chemotaxis protein